MDDNYITTVISDSTDKWADTWEQIANFDDFKSDGEIKFRFQFICVAPGLEECEGLEKISNDLMTSSYVKVKPEEFNAIETMMDIQYYSAFFCEDEDAVKKRRDENKKQLEEDKDKDADDTTKDGAEKQPDATATSASGEAATDATEPDATADPASPAPPA